MVIYSRPGHRSFRPQHGSWIGRILGQIVFPPYPKVNPVQGSGSSISMSGAGLSWAPFSPTPQSLGYSGNGCATPWLPENSASVHQNDATDPTSSIRLVCWIAIVCSRGPFADYNFSWRGWRRTQPPEIPGGPTGKSARRVPPAIESAALATMQAARCGQWRIKASGWAKRVGLRRGLPSLRKSTARAVLKMDPSREITCTIRW